MNFLSLIN